MKEKLAPGRFRACQSHTAHGPHQAPRWHSQEEALSHRLVVLSVWSWTSSRAWKLVRHANYQAVPRTCQSEPRDGPSHLCVSKPCG